ncbi:ATP phosphoribosyltransferase regulatory subunit [Tropicimonas isoalkanivorans]|uniref:ATP phosphoribosyltransferase regulatory subunit n=1 Tax=Tropicimonas isoalkanivorans TaxID=441112 RepID=A0A1I1KQW4_9RHOB|nr:ATP phosphoribosyltransferase regulatory subunit [Tropicimonas isoalkanivorans]SFC63177.1 ATP phosphoribosyltransferase regulatory subunit [Tropicimonas isoalkanivorans]
MQPSKDQVRAEAARLQAIFCDAGARAVDPDILQPAEVLLDLYGEDIRARAYVTADPLKGEQMMRPDFTVPVVQMHMASGQGAARYTYAGEVFRRQEVAEPGRSNEYFQVGLEIFDAEDPEEAEAEVFARFADALAPLGLRAAMGDFGLLTAAVGGLKASPVRKAALMRHAWRPHRFRALLDRYSGRTPVPAARADLLKRLTRLTPVEMITASGPLIGLRTTDEIAGRLERLRADAAEAPLPTAQVTLIDDLLSIRETPANALARLRDIAVDMPALDPALHRLERRLSVMRRHGVDLDAVSFEASYGRTTMEYYDGFVFGFFADRRPHLPPVASGGRYDALTRVLGQGREMPAVGGMIRPGLALELAGEGAA